MRFSRRRATAVVFALIAATIVGCGGRSASEEPSSDEQGWAVTVEPLPSPAGAASLAPQLTQSQAGALLSWIERGEGDHSTLRVSERGATGSPSVLEPF